MNAGLSRAIGRLRRPEYTGQNRCVPCTTVNVAIAVALAAGVALVEPVVAVAVFALSVAAIYLRGYLVPGTPTLTKRYFPDWLLATFDKEPAPGFDAVEVDDADDSDPVDAPDEQVDPERTLLESGVVEPCDDADDLCLAGDASERWRGAIESLRDGDRSAQIGAYLDVDPGTVSVSSKSRGIEARVDGQLAARWESDAALVADLAATEVLPAYVDGWTDLGVEARSRLANGLRAFAETCPDCGGPVSIGEETVESCCRSRNVYAVTCDDCETRILEVPQ